MLWFIGLGLGDEQDITVRGLEVVKKCARVFLEAYTAVLSVGQDRLVRTSHASHDCACMRAFAVCIKYPPH